MTRVTASKAIEALRHVVSSTPGGFDFVYTPPSDKDMCVYVRDGVPSCLVGQALAYLGVSIDVLEGLDTACEGKSASADVLAVYYLTTDTAGRVLQTAQSVQDRQEPWGKALEAAERYFSTIPKGIE